MSLLQTPLLDRLLSHAVIESSHHAEALALLHGEGVDAVARTQSKASRRAFWRARFPGPSGRWLVAIIVVVSALVWVAVVSDAVPACTDTQVAKTLRISLFQVMTRVRTANPLATARSPGPNMLLAEFQDVRELGYIKAERARACEATLHAGDESSLMT